MSDDYSPSHYWGDEWTGWDDLYEAEKYIQNYVYKWSRCRLISKEKYGTIRYEYIFPPGVSVRFGFHITIPYFKKKILGGKLEVPRFRWIYGQSWIARKWTQYGWWVCERAIKKAQKKWPNVAKEIMCDYLWRIS